MVAGCAEGVKRLLYKVKIKLSAPEDLGSNDSNLQEFSYTTIKAATQKFSSDNKLGEGGYGPVYKVTFRNCIHCLILYVEENLNAGPNCIRRFQPFISIFKILSISPSALLFVIYAPNWF